MRQLSIYRTLQDTRWEFMHLFHLDKMPNGAIVGDYESSVMQTRDFEVALHRFAKGEEIEPYFHVLAPEVNVIVHGRLSVEGEELGPGDIVMFHPKEVCRMEVLEDVELVVVKWPSVPGDAYPEHVRDRGRVIV